MPISRPRLLSFLTVAAAASAGACAMVLEVAGAHALAPGFGTGLTAWSAMITVALGGLACGYAVGGTAADRWPDRAACRLLPGSLAAAGLAFGIDALAWHRVVLGLTDVDARLGAVLAAGALFLVPFAALGAVYPLAVKLRTRTVAEVGRRSGRLSAASAVGSALGAAAAGFVLVPNLHLETVLGLAGGLLLLLAAVVLLAGGGRLTGFMALVLGTACVFVPPRPPGPGVLFRRWSVFGPVEVVDWGDVRYLQVAGTIQGMASRDEEHRPLFRHVNKIAAVLEENAALEDGVLLIGLGAGLLPRQLPPGACESVEIDSAVILAAERFFGFDTTRFPTHRADGRAFLATVRKQYGAIVIDAYRGLDPPYHLLTQECFASVRERLRSDGLLIVNFQGYLRGPEDRLVRALEATLLEVFPEVSICVWHESGDFGSAIFVAHSSDTGFAWPEVRDSPYNVVSTFQDSRPAVVLTDSRNPVALWNAAADRLRRRKPWRTE